MNKTEVMKQLRSWGTAQNRKVYTKHFGEIPMYGVSYANLGKLHRQIKTDHALALKLWDTGNLDARILAMKIADPAQSKVSQLDAWAKSSGNRGVASELSNFAARCPSAMTRIAKWTKSRDEFVGVAGWHTLSSVAREHEDVPEDLLVEYLEKIENTIDSAKNFTKHAMNNALISIGSRNARLKKLATAVAKRIGKVEVDHGKTSCTTPDATTQLQKSTKRKRH